MKLNGQKTTESVKIQRHRLSWLAVSKVLKLIFAPEDRPTCGQFVQISIKGWKTGPHWKQAILHEIVLFGGNKQEAVLQIKQIFTLEKLKSQ